MEFHDKMKKLKTNVYKAALMLGAIWAGLLFQQFFGDKTTPFHVYIITDVIVIVGTGGIIHASWFYYKRPDFVITEYKIVFSNLSLAFYSRNRIRVYTVEWEQIERAFILPTGITFKIKDFKEDIDVWEKHLDDYTTAKRIIMEQLEKRKIPYSTSSSYMSSTVSGCSVPSTLDAEASRSLEACPIVDASLIVPVFNEAESIELFLDRVMKVFNNEPSVQLDVVFVNDGSTDDTLERLLECQRRDQRIRIFDLSRNFGKEAALTAGLQAARGRVVIPIDVDLQDPPDLVIEMIARWREGYDVVLGRRVNRQSDSWAKRVSAAWFYRIHNWMAEPEIPENVGDFRLMDRAVVDALSDLPESRRFMKGLFAWVGFRTTVVDYARSKRAAGLGKFNGWRLWNFALEGLTSFSTDLLRIWTYLGGIVALASFFYGLFIVLRVWIFGIETPGFASVFVAVTFLGGLQLIGIGIIGEYLGRTYLESKRRPVFLVRHIYEPRG